MDNAIAVLANNMYFFKIFCSNYPKELVDIPLFVFNDTRIGNKMQECEDILKESGIKKYKVIGTHMVHAALKDIININEFAEDYTYSLNILIPLFMFTKTSAKRMLQLDDDIILRDGILRIFEENEMLMYHYCFCAGHKEFDKNSNDFLDMYNDFSDMIGNDWSYKDYLKNYANTGHVLYQKSQFNMEEYVRCLNWFFESSVTQGLWYSYEGRKKRNPMLMDEKWTSFVFRYYLNSELSKRKYVYLICEGTETARKRLNAMKKCSIIHVCNSNQKNATYEMFKEEGFIK